MKIFIMDKRLYFMIAVMLVLSACAGTERTEAVTAEIEAAQMEGRNAAREFVNAEWKDTMELQNRLLQVRSKQSKYVEGKMPEAAAAFDSAFVGTLRTVRPDIARELDRKPSDHIQ